MKVGASFISTKTIGMFNKSSARPGKSERLISAQLKPTVILPSRWANESNGYWQHRFQSMPDFVTNL